MVSSDGVPFRPGHDFVKAIVSAISCSFASERVHLHRPWTWRTWVVDFCANFLASLCRSTTQLHKYWLNRSWMWRYIDHFLTPEFYLRRSGGLARPVRCYLEGVPRLTRSCLHACLRTFIFYTAKIWGRLRGACESTGSFKWSLIFLDLPESLCLACR